MPGRKPYPGIRLGECSPEARPWAGRRRSRKFGGDSIYHLSTIISQPSTGTGVLPKPLAKASAPGSPTLKLRRPGGGDRESTPTDFVDLDRLTKAFRADRASAQKQRCLTRRLRDHLFCHEDLIGSRVRAESERQLDRSSEQIIIVLNRLAHAQTNPQVQRRVGMLSILRGERLLNGDRTFQRLVDRSKRRHDSIA